MNWLDNISSTAMNKSLDGLWKRQQAITDNIANYETPGYKKKVVSFENELKTAMNERTLTKAQRMDRIQETQPSMQIVENETLRADGNNVDIEQENIELARAQLQYNLVIRQLNDHFSRLRYAISGGASK